MSLPTISAHRLAPLSPLLSWLPSRLPSPYPSLPSFFLLSCPIVLPLVLTLIPFPVPKFVSPPSLVQLCPLDRLALPSRSTIWPPDINQPFCKTVLTNVLPNPLAQTSSKACSPTFLILLSGPSFLTFFCVLSMNRLAPLSLVICQSLPHLSSYCNVSSVVFGPHYWFSFPNVAGQTLCVLSKINTLSFVSYHRGLFLLFNSAISSRSVRVSPSAAHFHPCSPSQ